MNQSSSTPYVVADYLQRLEKATADLPPDVRDDLVADVRSHLDEIVERAGSEAQLREAIDRLGSPEEIAAEAGAGRPPAPLAVTAPASATSGRGFDVTALLFLVLGGPVLALVFLALRFSEGLVWLGLLLGWIIGLGMLWASRSWTFGEKLLASLVWPGGLGSVFLLWSMPTQVCTTTADSDGAFVESCTGFAMAPWVGIPLMLLTVAAPLVVAGLLVNRADRRR